jgi:hypothetical protein
MSNEIPRSVQKLQSRTKWLYRGWWITHYTVGFTGVLAGALITAASSNATSSNVHGTIAQFRIFCFENTWLIAIVATVSASLVTLLGPIQKAERYWSAFHVLDQGCLEYEQGQIGPRAFFKRVQQARRILQAVDPDERWSSEAKDGEHEAKSLANSG